jgi:hypothetical protein
MKLSPERLAELAIEARHVATTMEALAADLEQAQRDYLSQSDVNLDGMYAALGFAMFRYELEGMSS